MVSIINPCATTIVNLLRQDLKNNIKNRTEFELIKYADKYIHDKNIEKGYLPGLSPDWSVESYIDIVNNSRYFDNFMRNIHPKGPENIIKKNNLSSENFTFWLNIFIENLETYLVFERLKNIDK